MISSRTLALAFSTLLLVGGCHARQDSVPGDRADTRPWHGIEAAENLHFTGTEPFWGGEVSGSMLTYRTPENVKGERVAVSRFSGRGGTSFSGALSEGSFTLAVSNGPCTDGMSDRQYPFMATITLGERTLKGCAWTDQHPFIDARP